MIKKPLTIYEDDIERLEKLYKGAFESIALRLKTIDYTAFDRAMQLALLQDIGNTLVSLNEDMAPLVESLITSVAVDGIIVALIDTGIAQNVSEARKVLTITKTNKALIQAIVADTQADLLEITQNVERRVRAAIRQVASEVFRENMVQGRNATRWLSSELVRQWEEKLGKAAHTAIIDARGTRWEPAVYAKLIVKTKMMQAHKESTINEAIDKGSDYGVITKHNAKDACAKYEGTYVKLRRDAEGDMPYYEDLPHDEIFHPNCQHRIFPVSERQMKQGK